MIENDQASENGDAARAALYLNELLHLSFEALVVENAEYHRLFSADDMAEMRRLLREHGYQSGGSNRSDGVT